MGHTQESTLFFVGMARLPQPCVAGHATLAVEVEVAPSSRRILTLSSTLPLPGLDRVLQEALVGECVDEAHEALLYLDVRYSSPFSTALCAAVRRALLAAKNDAPTAAKACGRSAVVTGA